MKLYLSASFIVQDLVVCKGFWLQLGMTRDSRSRMKGGFWFDTQFLRFWSHNHVHLKIGVFSGFDSSSPFIHKLTNLWMHGEVFTSCLKGEYCLLCIQMMQVSRPSQNVQSWKQKCGYVMSVAMCVFFPTRLCLFWKQQFQYFFASNAFVQTLCRLQ